MMIRIKNNNCDTIGNDDNNKKHAKKNNPVPSPVCGSQPCWEMKARASARPQVKWSIAHGT